MRLRRNGYTVLAAELRRYTAESGFDAHISQENVSRRLVCILLHRMLPPIAQPRHNRFYNSAAWNPFESRVGHNRSPQRTPQPESRRESRTANQPLQLAGRLPSGSLVQPDFVFNDAVTT